MKRRPVVLVLGPSRDAVSGVSTHLNLLLASVSLAREFELVHFQVGGEGRGEAMLGRWLRLVASPFGLAAKILRHEAAVLHVNTSLNPRAYWRDLAYLAVAKLCGARVLYQVHGGALPQNFFGAQPAAHRASCAGRCGMPDVVVVLASIELEAYRAFVPGQQVALLPNGIDQRPLPARTDGAAPRSRKRRSSSSSSDGSRARRASTRRCEALRLAAQLGVDARLLVAGDGPEEDGLRRRVQELALRREVTFVGPARSATPRRGCSARPTCSCCRRYAEGLPYALLEAMAAGRCRCSPRRVGAIPDVVAEGMHGLFVPARDPQERSPRRSPRSPPTAASLAA